ncbi:hypothetical protein YYC_02193 [Plasmodium yoelii 17X]|uniref:Fam-a protein n=3 Tax=Plasmodium yoelii TaxID=5861 RepID=Q7RDI3_PLAYO|nr:hypothetical protein [Plasmodium yoelii yoelii]ETB60549.1 hypothetical protein YYC_02193 [Plasmodium yoelii 17X]
MLKKFIFKLMIPIIYQLTNNIKYNEIINMLWNTDYAIFSILTLLKMQRYKKKSGHREKYFYALATKVEISKDRTIIVMVSADINDHNPSNKEYKNAIIKNANSFKTDIDSEDDIKQEKLKKAFVNITGYLIQKYRCVNITYIKFVSDIQILIT